jgi:hypothetical protein
MRRYSWLLTSFAVLTASCVTIGDDGSRLMTVDHYIQLKSTAPGLAGRDAQI